MTREDFLKAVSREEINEIKIIQFALLGGVAIFMFIVIVMYLLTEQKPDATSEILINILTLINCLALIGAFIISPKLQQKAYQQGSQERQGGEGFEKGLAQEILAKIRMGEIARMAIFEGAAFIGLVTCLLGVFVGIMQAHPIYWLNLLPALVLMMLVKSELITKERLGTIFDTHFATYQ